MPGSTEFRVGARSVQGAREENQDRMTRFSSAFGEVLAVADGMGGHKGGALAAETVVASIQSSFRAASPQISIEQVLRQVVAAANEAVHQRSQQGDPTLREMGSTLVMALLEPGDGELTLRLAHVGDSRAYLLRDGVLQQVTRDHSVLEELLGMGVSAAEANAKPNRNHLTRAIGPRTQVEAELGEPLPLRPGDRVLLCSDGLHGFVDAGVMQSILSSREAPVEIAEALVRAALDAGSDDNVSVQILDFSPEKPGRQTVKIPALDFSEPRPPESPLTEPPSPEPPISEPLLSEPPPQEGKAMRRAALLWPVAGALAVGLGLGLWYASSRATPGGLPVTASESPADPATGNGSGHGPGTAAGAGVGEQTDTAAPKGTAAQPSAGGQQSAGSPPAKTPAAPPPGQPGTPQTTAPGKQPSPPPDAGSAGAGAPAKAPSCELRIVCGADCSTWKGELWWQDLRKEFPSLQERHGEPDDDPSWLPELSVPEIVDFKIEHRLLFGLAREDRTRGPQDRPAR